MPNSTLTRSAVAVLGCLLVTAAQAQEPAQPNHAPAVTQDTQLCRNVSRPGSRIANRQCATATEWARVEAVRRLQPYPHEGWYGYTAPPSVTMNR